MSEAILGQLDALNAQRKEAERVAREVRQQQNVLILQAVAADVPIAQVAKRAGLTRQTVYGIVLREESKKK